MKSPISPRFLSALFTSLSSPSTSLSTTSNNLPTRQWHLHRILRSDNPADINGELNGIATFHPLHHTPSSEDATAYRQMVYKEEGEMPSSVMGMAGLRWTKKYIWRLNGAASTDQEQQDEENNPEMGGISVWFVKIKSSKEKAESGDQDEPDYLFHEFDFNYRLQKQQETTETADTTKPKFEPPTPPPLILPDLRDKYSETAVIQATGDHLCIKDMYYTAYSFRVVPETGEVLSWASRHVVKGPKKNQDILNLYSIQ